MGGLSAIVSCFLIVYSKQSGMSDIEHDPSGKWNSSFQAGAENLNLLLLYADLMFLHLY